MKRQFPVYIHFLGAAAVALTGNQAQRGRPMCMRLIRRKLREPAMDRRNRQLRAARSPLSREHADNAEYGDDAWEKKSAEK
jgi:hypothetical protein